MAAKWAENVLAACLGLRAGESLLVIVDRPLREPGWTLCAAGRALGASNVALQVLDLERPFSVLPEGLLREAATADVVVSFLSRLDLRQEVPPLRAAMAAFRSVGKGRWASGAGIDDKVLACELATDPQATRRCVEDLAAGLTGADHLRITTRAGTDLRLRLGTRPLHRETGLLLAPGDFGNLPGGEVYVAPLEESAEGLLVVDLCLGDLPLDAPVSLEFRGGRVVSATGGRALQELRRRLGQDPWAWTVGEFGLGAHPHARLRGRVTIDEKVLGTGHIALGGNRSFGGLNPAATHYDCVFRDPSITKGRGA